MLFQTTDVASSQYSLFDRMIRNDPNISLSPSYNTSLLGLAWYTSLRINIFHLSIPAILTDRRYYISLFLSFSLFSSFDFYFLLVSYWLFSIILFNVFRSSFIELSFLVFMLWWFDVSHVVTQRATFTQLEVIRRNYWGGERLNSLQRKRNSTRVRFYELLFDFLFCIFIFMYQIVDILVDCKY